MITMHSQLNTTHALRAGAAVWVLSGLPKIFLIITLVLKILLAGGVLERRCSIPRNLKRGGKLMKIAQASQIIVLLGEIALVGTQP